VYDFENGLAWIKRDGKVGIINSKMDVVIEPKYEAIKSFEGGFARVKNTDRWGIIDKTGKVIVDVIYDDIGDYYQGVAWAKSGGSFGLVNGSKFTAIDGVTKIWDFSNGMAYAKKGEKIGFIDTKGNWVIEPKFDKAKAFNKDSRRFSWVKNGAISMTKAPL
jgi:hypothetical protein